MSNAPRYSRNPGVLAADLGGDEMALLGPRGDHYVGLNETAAAIWTALQTPASVDELCDRLLEEFDAERDEMERDVKACLAELMRDGLVVPQG